MDRHRVACNCLPARDLEFQIRNYTTMGRRLRCRLSRRVPVYEWHELAIPLLSVLTVRAEPVLSAQHLGERADLAYIERPELRVLRARDVEAHFRYDLLEVERIAGKQRHSPLPRVEPDRSGDDLLHTTGVTPSAQSVLVHQPASLRDRERIPVLTHGSALGHRIERHVRHRIGTLRIQPPLDVRVGSLRFG